MTIFKCFKSLSRRSWLATLLLGVFLWTGCETTPGGSSTASVKNVAANPEILRVGVTASLPPMIFKEGGTYKGIEAELAHQLAEKMGRKVVFVDVPWDQQINALIEGKTDIIMSSMSVTTIRQARISFSRPYMRSGQVALVRRDELSKMQIFLFSENYKIGVQKGTTGEYFTELNMGQSTRVPFTDPEKAVDALIKKKIDAFINDATISWWLASKYENKGVSVLPKLLTQEVLGWGIRKEDTVLQQAANNYLAGAEQDGSLNALISKWIPNFGSQ